MSSLRIAIVEDEEVAARRLARLVGEILDERRHRLHHLSTLDSALAQMGARPFDLLFLDLNLYGRDGFQLLRKAVAQPFHTIVVSAHTDRAVEAFELGVLDFVAKPYSRVRLEKALHRALDGEQRSTGARVLALRKVGRVEWLPIDRVALLRGAGNYVEVVTEDGARHLHDKTLDRLAQLLPPRFQRVHRSYIVDTGRVRSCATLGGGRYRAELADGTRVPVSRSFIDALRRTLEGP